MKRTSLGHVLGYTALTVMLTAGAAQSLSGTNTVDSGDIIDGQVAYADIRDNAMTGKKLLDNSVTGADIRESTIPGFRRTYFARVSSTGVLDSTNGGATSSEKFGTASYRVRFPFKIESCAATASVGHYPGASSLTFTSYTAMPVLLSNSFEVVVYTRTTSAAADLPFMLILTCP